MSDASKRFVEVLEVIGGGGLINEAADAITEAGMAVAQTGKAASVTVQIAIKPNGTGSALLSGKVTAKVPKPAILDSLFFITSGGQFLRDDPAQEKLPLAEGYNIHSLKGA